MNRLVFELEPTPPFRLDLTVWALRRRPDNCVDCWDGATYRRALTLGGGPATVAVRQVGPPDTARLQVTLSAAHRTRDPRPAVTAILERALGLSVDLSAFYQQAQTDPRLGPLASRFRGLKPPRFPTLFETLANAIACQQVTLTLGIRLLNRLVETCGPAALSNGRPAHAFPRPTDLAPLEPDALRGLGFSRQKAQALVGLARAIGTGGLVLDELASLDDATALARLQQLHGVGRWTAEYVLLRGLGRLHVFPGDDVGARASLERWLGQGAPLDHAGVQRALAPWRPYGGLVYLHLLLDRLADTGYLPA